MKKSKKRNNSFKRRVKKTKKKGLNRKIKKSKKVRKLSRKQYGGSLYGLRPASAQEMNRGEPATEQGVVAQAMDSGEPELDQGPTQIVAQNVKLRNEINELKDEIEILTDKLRVSENDRRSLEEENQLLKAGKQLTEIKGQLEETKQKKEELEELKQQLENNLKEAVEERDDYYEIIEQQRVELGEKDGQLHEAANLVRQFDKGRDQEKEENKRLTDNLNAKEIELARATEELEQVQGELDKARGELDEAQGELDEAQGELEQSVSFEKELLQQNETQIELNKYLEEELAEIKKELEAEREANKRISEQQLLRTSSSSSEEEEENSELEEEASVLRAENAELRETNRKLEEENKENSGLEVQLSKVISELTEVKRYQDDTINRADQLEKINGKLRLDLKAGQDKIIEFEKKVSFCESKGVAQAIEIKGLQEKINKLNEDKRMLQTRLANIQTKTEIIVREKQANSKSTKENERLRQGLAEIHDLAKQQSSGVSEEETDLFSSLNLGEEDTRVLQTIMGIPHEID